MDSKTTCSLVGVCGLAGSAGLLAYNAAPWTFMPLPPDNATVDQVLAFGAHYHTAILWDTWFQAAGSLLSVVFALALVQLAGAGGRLAGKLTLLAGAVILVLALIEGLLGLATLQMGADGHAAGSVYALDIISTFVHVFPLAPSLFLVMGAAIWGSPVLPPGFAWAAVTLGAIFQALGVVSLFNAAALLAVIAILVIQLLWTVAASILLLIRPVLPSDSAPAFALAGAGLQM